MRPQQEIEEKLKEIQSQPLLQEPKATIEINAPVALQQLVFETEVDVLKWVLGQK